MRKKKRFLFIYFRGTALSRHTPLQSSTFTRSATNNIQDDQLPIVTVDNDDDLLPVPQIIEHPTEIRRPRVYFADFNKIQFIEDHTETSQPHRTPIDYTRRRHRRRSSKKISDVNGTNPVPPSIQQTQILQNFSRPLSRQPNSSIAHELSIKKQQLLTSPRVHSSRMTHLPDILNQSLPIESSSNEHSNGKYSLQREKPLIRLQKPAIEIPTALTIDTLSEDIRNRIARSSPAQDSHIQTHESELGEGSNVMLLHSTQSTSSTSINRQRPSLRTISLRQQFIAPIKLKTTNSSSTKNNNYNQQMNNSVLNSHQSASLKQSTSRIPNGNDDRNSTNGSLLTTENRVMTGNRSLKQLKRSDVIHFNSKTSLGVNPTNDSNKSNLYEPKQERFQNLLTIVRPPYATGNGNSSNISSFAPNDSTIQTINHNHRTGSYHSTRSTSARGSFGFHTTTNTVFV